MDAGMEKEFLEELEQKREIAVQTLKSFNLSYGELLQVASLFMIGEQEQSKLVDELLMESQKVELALRFIHTDFTKLFEEHPNAVFEYLLSAKNAVAKAFIKGVSVQKRSHALKAVNSRHSKPGGNRDKQAAIRKIWATGKYTSKDICAEQECAALNMSFSAARKALREKKQSGLASTSTG
jgi:hypothetical protein